MNKISSPDGNVEFLLHLLNKSGNFIGRLERTDNDDFSKTGHFDASLRVNHVTSRVSSSRMFYGDVHAITLTIQPKRLGPQAYFDVVFDHGLPGDREKRLGNVERERAESSSFTGTADQNHRLVHDQGVDDRTRG